VEVSGQLHASTALPPVPNGKEAGWAPEPVWMRWQRDKLPSSPLPGFEPRLSSPQPSHYTDWVTPWMRMQIVALFGLSYRRQSEHLLSRYEGVTKSFRTGRLQPELQIAQLFATRCSCIAILWLSLVSFAAITLHVVSQSVLIVVVDFVIDSVRKLLDKSSYFTVS